MSVTKRLDELGIVLPAPIQPVGSYIPAIRTGTLVMTSGQLPMVDGKLSASGKVPDDVSIEQAQQAARTAAINALVAISGVTPLDRVQRVVRLGVFVNSSAGFTQQAQVANGASDFLVQLFGEQGKHVRAAVGVAELPLNASVELEITVEVS